MNENQIPPGIIAFKRIDHPLLPLSSFKNAVSYSYEDWVKQHLNYKDLIWTISVGDEMYSIGDETTYGKIERLDWSNGWVAFADKIFRILENPNCKLPDSKPQETGRDSGEEKSLSQVQIDYYENKIENLFKNADAQAAEISALKSSGGWATDEDMKEAFNFGCDEGRIVKGFNQWIADYKSKKSTP